MPSILRVSRNFGFTDRRCGAITTARAAAARDRETARGKGHVRTPNAGPSVGARGRRGAGDLRDRCGYRTRGNFDTSADRRCTGDGGGAKDQLRDGTAARDGAHTRHALVPALRRQPGADARAVGAAEHLRAQPRRRLRGSRGRLRRMRGARAGSRWSNAPPPGPSTGSFTARPTGRAGSPSTRPTS